MYAPLLDIAQFKFQFKEYVIATQFDTGNGPLVRVTWAMMRAVVNNAMQEVTSALDAIGLPGGTLQMSDIKDCEDAAIGAGILSKNNLLFPDKQQVTCCLESA